MKKLEFINLEVCDEAADWASGKTWQEVYTSCHRGDWLLWLFAKTNPDNLQELTLAKGHCANTARHLMKDERSIKAVDAAIAYGEGKISKEDLNIAAYAADAAATAYAAYADAAYDAAKKENQKQTADICRKYLPIELWNILKLNFEIV